MSIDHGGDAQYRRPMVDRRLVDERVLAVGDVIAARGQGGLDGLHVHLPESQPIECHWTEVLRRDVFSVSKTFVSVAVGIAEAEGLLSLDDPDPRCQR